MCILLISLVNNDFQINKCTIILHTDKRLCYALSILSITYIPFIKLLLKHKPFFKKFLLYKFREYIMDG